MRDSRWFVTAAAACVIAGFIIGALVGNLLLDARAEQRRQTRQTPAAEAPDFVVEVLSDDPSAVGVLAPGVVGGLIGIVGALGAQALGAVFTRRYRRQDLRKTHIDGMLTALDELERAFAEDMASETPSRFTETRLLMANNRFERSVVVLRGDELRRLALEWRNSAQRYALVYGGEGEEEGPTAQDVMKRQADLMSAVEAVITGVR